MKTILKKQAGFALLEILVFAALLPPALLVASHASDVVSKSSQFFKSSSTKNSLNVIKAYLVTQASNPESDGVFGLQKDATGGSGGALPGALPLNTADEWGTSYRYCNWDTGVANTMNATFSQNTVGAPGGGVIGQVISAGKDKTFQTTCGAASASGDDLLVKIYNSDVLNSQGGIAGWKDDGSSVTLLNPADNVGLGVSAPTHKLEFAAGTTPAGGIAFGEVELYRSAANVLALATGNSLNLDSGAISMGGSTVIDSSRNLTGNNLTLDGGLVTMNNATSNMILMGTAIAPPSTVARSDGTRIVLYPAVGGGLADHAMGVDNSTLWNSIPLNASSNQFKWYGGATNVMTLDGAGHLGVGTAPNATYSINSAGAINASAYYVNGVLIGSNASGTVAGQMSYWDGAAWSPTSEITYSAGTGAVNIAAGDLQLGGVSVITSARNLTGVNAVAQNLIPGANNTYNLGSGVSQWANIYGQNIYQNGNKVIDTVAGGTIGYIPKFNGASSIGNSQIYDNGTGVGIGSSTPGALSGTDTGARLELVTSGLAGAAGTGALRWYGNNGTYVGWIAKADAVIDTNAFGGARLSFTTPDSAGVPVQTLTMKAGKVGIGTTAPWMATKLDVHQTGNPGTGGWGVAGYFHTSGAAGDNIAVNPEAIVATPGTNYGLYATAANGAAGNVAIFVPAAYPPVGANNYAIKSESAAQSYLAGSLGIGVSGATVKVKVAGDIESNNLIRATGWLTGTGTGQGAELGVSGGYSYLLAYDRSAAGYSPLRVSGSTVDIRATNSISAIYIPGTGNVLMGSTTDTNSKLQVTGAALGTFTGGGRGVVALTTPYDGASYTGIDFNYSANTGVQARIAARLTGSGSYLMLGTSNNYGSGVTNTAVTIDPSANVTISNALTVGANITAASYSGAVTGSTYGGMTLSGITNGYSGIYESAAAGTVVGMYDGAGNGGDYDPVTGWHFYWSRANTCLGIGGSATTAGYRAQVNGALNVTGNINTPGVLTVGGPIFRSAAGAGYLNGYYGTVETSATSGTIYSIGGAYIPTATTLGNMYGIGFGYSGNAGITATGVPASRWGMYVASGGVSRIFLDGDGGNIYANGTIYSAGNAVLTASATGQINAPSASGAGGFISSGNYGGTGNAAWFPSGIYSAGSNWLYGSVVFNGAVYGATTVSATTSVAAPDIYATNGWFRADAGLTGLYNSANGNHIYSESANYWTVTSAGNTAGGLIFRDAHQSTLRGYIYHDTSGFGLLHSNGGWAVRVTPTTTDLYGTTITANGNFVSTGTITGTTVNNAVYN